MWPSSSVTSLPAVLEFYAVTTELWAAFTAAIGDPGEDMRILASIPPEIIARTCTSATMTDGRRLTPVEAIHLGLVFWACHRLVHLQSGGGVETWKDPNPWDSTTGGTATTTTPSSTTSTLQGDRKLKFSQVLEQGDETEFLCEPEAAKAAYYSKFVAVMGNLPEEAEDPSIEQLSALARRVTLKQGIYVDFAVWVPYSRKHMRAAKYQSFLLQDDGSFLSKMMAGPSCFRHWQASFRVLRSALVMLGLVNLANLVSWEAWVEKLNFLHPGCWHLIVAAEDRARGEHMSRTLTKIKLEIDQGGAAPLGWLEAKPWNVVWHRVLQDKDYWTEQVTVPAITWVAKGQKGLPKTPLEEQASEVLRGGAASLMPEISKDNNAEDINDVKKASGRRREARKRRRQNDREELKAFRAKGKGKGDGKDGGRKGSGGGKSSGGAGEVCYAWNNGNGLCGGLAPGEKCMGKIPREHKCSLCGSPGHPSKDCTSRKA